jgi:hypothetical protein
MDMVKEQLQKGGKNAAGKMPARIENGRTRICPTHTFMFYLAASAGSSLPDLNAS